MLCNAVLFLPLPLYLLFCRCKSQNVGEKCNLHQQKSIHNGAAAQPHVLGCNVSFNLNFKGLATMWFYFYIQGNGNILTDKYTLGLSARFIFDHIEKLPNPVGVSAFWWMNSGYVTGMGQANDLWMSCFLCCHVEMLWFLQHRWREIHTLPWWCCTETCFFYKWLTIFFIG